MARAVSRRTNKKSLRSSEKGVEKNARSLRIKKFRRSDKLQRIAANCLSEPEIASQVCKARSGTVKAVKLNQKLDFRDKKVKRTSGLNHYSTTSKIVRKVRLKPSMHKMAYKKGNQNQIENQSKHSDNRTSRSTIDDGGKNEHGLQSRANVLAHKNTSLRRKDGMRKKMPCQNQSKEKAEEGSYKFVNFENKVPGFQGILMLTHSGVVAVCGFADIALLHGKAEICGYNLKVPRDGIVEFVPLISPSSSSLLCIKDANCEEKIDRRTLKVILNSICPSLVDAINKKINSLVKVAANYSSMLLLKDPVTCVIPYLHHMNVAQHLPRELEFYEVSDCKHPVFSENHLHPALTRVQEKLAEDGPAGFSVMVCGGSNVGKSTLSRYIVNNLLNSLDEVFYLECDCGQTEFTPAAILSLVRVTKPVLGPAYSHQLRPVKSFFYGYNSPNIAPTDYISLLSELFKEYWFEYGHRSPLIINQHGWVKGRGLQLLVDCMRLMAPSIVIQLNSLDFHSRNLHRQLSADFVEEAQGFSTALGMNSLSGMQKEASYCSIYKPANSRSFEYLEAKKSTTSRNLALMAYFSHLYAHEFEAFVKAERDYRAWKPTCLADVPMRRIAWNRIAVHVVHEQVNRQLILNALNMSVVALARVDESLIEQADSTVDPDLRFLKGTSSAEFVGLGIVRNIEIASKSFLIITPESSDRLSRVNVLLRGNIDMPPAYLTADPRSVHPYFCYDYVAEGSKGSSHYKCGRTLHRRSLHKRRDLT